jgi:hypothetical protein
MTTLLADVKFHISSAPFSGGLGYLAVVLALHRAMAHRKTPVSIPKGVLVLYNVVQVVVNAYVAYAIAHAVGGWVFGLGVRESPAVRHGVYLHYLCKYLDMFDTVIIALRKKSEQLSFLHLYHHSTIVVVWGWVVHTWPAEGSSAVYSYGAWINSVVHVVMYFYYGLTAVGIRPPFKKAVTIFQLSQFGSCIVHALAVRPPLAPRRLPARTRRPSPGQLPAYHAGQRHQTHGRALSHALAGAAARHDARHLQRDAGVLPHLDAVPFPAAAAPRQQGPARGGRGRAPRARNPEWTRQAEWTRGAVRVC